MVYFGHADEIGTVDELVFYLNFFLFLLKGFCGCKHLHVDNLNKFLAV